MAATELDNVSAMLEWQFKTIWDTYGRGDHDDAEQMAAELLMEPRLSDFHQAGMHLLLSMSPIDYIHHGNEAVRLYQSVLNETIEMSPKQRATIERMLNDAKISLEQGRADKAAILRNIEKLIASGKTMKDLQDENIREMHAQLELDLVAAGSRSDAHDTEKAPVADREAIRPSTSLPETVSQSTGVGRSQSTALTEIDIDFDDNSSLPDINQK
ncbi:hypothetical protein CkaCkLH20_06574 [Colletotrichum karsti]|uniref:Uncharacterized protein n=1 Tax=Colletotrichum karsti TaxID=1095194 RepID=A0A9P6I2J6_9PEZI|nr:uncharacterized protein CkaCkLH20_06574 [Colletotrichum karsti]KAF9876128.1 hypothetical protein CkaCkLH20_06574 [Colletotrichum karsti]